MENKSIGDLVGQNLIKSRERVSLHGEVFTAQREVNAMLNLVKPETERIESCFLEPACGNGNFLAEILNRKLAILSSLFSRSRIDYEFNAIVAVGSIYGIEIQVDNVEECRTRLFEIFREEYLRLFKNLASTEFLKSIKFIIDTNILWGDALTLKTPDGSAPITFAEWSAVTAGNIKRRDFTLDNLLQNQPIDEPNLFSDLGDEAFILRSNYNMFNDSLTPYYNIKLYRFGDNGYVNESQVLNRKNLISKYKVLVSKASPGGDEYPHSIVSQPIISEPYSICTETYLVIKDVASYQEAENLVSYIKTRFFRFMMSLVKNTQNISKASYMLVPIQDFSKPWTDEELYAKYGLIDEEIEFIESMIRPME